MVGSLFFVFVLFWAFWCRKRKHKVTKTFHPNISEVTQQESWFLRRSLRSKMRHGLGAESILFKQNQAMVNTSCFCENLTLFWDEWKSDAKSKVLWFFDRLGLDIGGIPLQNDPGFTLVILGFSSCFIIVGLWLCHLLAKGYFLIQQEVYHHSWVMFGGKKSVV